MFELVPSKHMRQVFAQNGFVLLDFDKATLIWNANNKSLSGKMEALAELADITENSALKRQIRERAEYENAMMERHKENSAGTYVYVVLDEEQYSRGFFAKYDMAHEYGMKHAGKYEEMRFSIEKHRIVSGEGDLTVRSAGRTNWNLISKEELEEYKYSEYSGNAVSASYYSSDGTMQSIWSNEMSDAEESVVDPYRKDRFESRYFKIPFEGKIGTPVRVIASGTYGILLQDTEGWNRYVKNIENRNLYVDFSDIQVEVVSLTEKGEWIHSHINPVHLEVENPTFDKTDRKTQAYIRAFEAFSEYWQNKSKERGTRAIEAAKQYRDVCIETAKEEAKSRVDGAETPEDLIL